MASARLAVVIVSLRWAARQPACWLAAAVGCAAPLVPVPSPWTGGVAAIIGGLVACAAVGTTAGAVWIAARAAWPAIALVGGAASAGDATFGAASLAGLAAAVALIGRLRHDASAADATTAALVATALVGGLAAAAAAVAGDPRVGGVVAVGAAGLVVVATRLAGDRGGWLFDPLPWSLGRPPGPCPATTRLRSMLLSAAMVSGLATMVGGLFLLPSATVAALVGGTWLVALAAPPACLGALADGDDAIRRSALVGPSTAVRIVAWHTAVVVWPMCVAIALAAGDRVQLAAAAWSLATVTTLAIALALTAVWGRWGNGGAGGVGRGETALALALGLAAGMMLTGVNAVTRRTIASAAAGSGVTWDEGRSAARYPGLAAFERC